MPLNPQSFPSANPPRKPPFLSRTLAVFALLASGGCASQSEFIRLQAQVVELTKQLEYENRNLVLQQEKLKKAQAEAATAAEPKPQ